MEMDNKNMIELAEKYGEAMTKKYGNMNSAAIGCITPNILVGANWAFLTPNEGRELKQLKFSQEFQCSWVLLTRLM